MQKCSGCEKTFTCKNNGIRHERTVHNQHGGIHKAKCNLCHAEFSKNSDFVRHNKLLHESKAVNLLSHRWTRYASQAPSTQPEPTQPAPQPYRGAARKHINLNYSQPVPDTNTTSGSSEDTTKSPPNKRTCRRLQLERMRPNNSPSSTESSSDQDSIPTDSSSDSESEHSTTSSRFGEYITRSETGEDTEAPPNTDRDHIQQTPAHYSAISDNDTPVNLDIIEPSISPSYINSVTEMDINPDFIEQLNSGSNTNDSNNNIPSTIADANIPTAIGNLSPIRSPDQPRMCSPEQAHSAEYISSPASSYDPDYDYVSRTPSPPRQHLNKETIIIRQFLHSPRITESITEIRDMATQTQMDTTPVRNTITHTPSSRSHSSNHQTSQRKEPKMTQVEVQNGETKIKLTDVHPDDYQQMLTMTLRAIKDSNV